ncbi:MAG: tryptophan synthase subunit alpha [Bacteroidota bacterium]
MKNKVRAKIELKGKNLLSIYFTAGFPAIDDSPDILEALENAGVDFVEVGMPFSDPLADGPVIQECASVALKNGMKMQLLFDQLKSTEADGMPRIWMGYVNQLMQFGFDKFLNECKSCGIDTVIVPDMPISTYEDEYKAQFESAGITPVFLISPQTSEERIRKIDALSSAFIYVVSDSSITGAKSGISEAQVAYFERIKAMELKNPCIIGFGISNEETFNMACNYASGAIIGSAFLKSLKGSDDLNTKISQFIKKIRP